MTDQRSNPDCTDIRAMLSEVLDGTLDGDDRHGVERHLAGCAACRELLGEAERADALLAACVAADEPAALPDGFEAAVLARTSGAPGGRSRRTLRAWLGPLAAAACLLLAGALWILGPSARRSAVQTTATYTAGPELRSWPREEPAPADAQPAVRLVVNEVAVYPPEAGAPAAQQRGVGRRLASMAERRDVSRESAETLETASWLLELLERDDAESFEVVEHVRKVTEYDNLLPKLDAARRDLPEEDRLAVFAAEAALYRVVNGPLSQQEMRELQRSIAALDLAGQISEMARPQTRSAPGA